MAAESADACRAAGEQSLRRAEGITEWAVDGDLVLHDSARQRMHALNIPRHGGRGIDVLARIVERAECFALTYSDATDAVASIAGGMEHNQPAEPLQ
jgi:hypothetical protein